MEVKHQSPFSEYTLNVGEVGEAVQDWLKKKGQPSTGKMAVRGVMLKGNVYVQEFILTRPDPDVPPLQK